MQPEDKGWMIKTKRRKRAIPILAREEGHTRVNPTRRFWLGFDILGNEKWFIELDNGKIISCTDESYNYWLKRYLFKDV